jgi:integrase
MSPRPRIRRRANWPANMHEPRPGYFTWRDPRDGKTHILGRIPLAQAIHEAQDANAVVEKANVTRTLAERLEASAHTLERVIERMSTEGLSANTLKGLADHDKVILEKFPNRDVASIETTEIAELLEEIKARGKNRWAQAIRARCVALFDRAVSLGWCKENRARVTEQVKRKRVQRKRLTMEQFRLILAKAPEVAPWLADMMMLALVSGQDRSTVAAWPRAAVKDGEAVVYRQKTKKWIAIPVSLRMNEIGLSLGDVIDSCKSAHIASPFLIHHKQNRGGIKRGAPINLQTISLSFAAARKLAGIPDENAPSFHEIRSLAKRTYMDQGGVDTKALLGHSDDKTADLYADNRGIAPIKVRVS